MSTYAIGDIQGCYQTFLALLNSVEFRPGRDELWAVGDLVNRGPDNLSVLRWFFHHQDSVRLVLGNHDLHLLAAADGARALAKSDNLEDILQAEDRESLLDWLRQQPLLFRRGQHVMTHAGIPALWSVEEANQYAGEVSEILKSEARHAFFRHMYGNQPSRWSHTLTGFERLRTITNYLTRMRFINRDGELNFREKGSPSNDNARKPSQSLRPWFEYRAPSATKILFGHWAALGGETGRRDIIALDTGCVWGDCLTLMNLETGQRSSLPSRD